MCGIFGIINLNGKSIKKNSLECMKESIKHRGPNDDGYFIDKNVGFGFVRLSILDLSNQGHQPMVSDDEQLVLIFNGEIYNYLELKNKLKNNYTFKSQTDTEVLLKSYQEWGKKCLNKLNGMFSFVIYDKKKNEIFIARDRFGIKPLYYFTNNNKFIFSSEITPILKVLPQKNIIQNDQTIYDYLVFNRTCHTNQTFFKNVKKLQHGHYLILKNKKIKTYKWYDLNKKVQKKIKIHGFTQLTELKDKFINSINLRLRSDVLVGACLSGGIDSSSIVSTILKIIKKNDLNTVSAVYKKKQIGDESHFINLYKKNIKKILLTRVNQNNFLKDMNDFISCMEEPVTTTSYYAEYKVYELAKKNKITVLLSGQGADEEMAGYLYFQGFFYKELIKKLKIKKLLINIFYDLNKHKNFIGIQSFLYFLLPFKIKDIINKNSIRYLNQDFSKKYQNHSLEIFNLYNSPNLHESLINHFEYKFEHHLIYGDRSSMWFSTEVRFPFLDNNFVEAALSLPTEEILHKGTTKYALRQIMKNIVPQKILNRMDKIGYETPENEWFRDKKIKKIVNKIINSKSFKKRPYFKHTVIKKLYQAHLSKKINIGNEIWKWINIELWLRKFVD